MTGNSEGAQESMNESRTCAPIDARLTHACSRTVRRQLLHLSSGYYREALRPFIRQMMTRIEHPPCAAPQRKIAMHPEETVCNRVRDSLARKSSPASRCRGTLEPLGRRNGENGEPRRPIVAEPVERKCSANSGTNQSSSKTRPNYLASLECVRHGTGNKRRRAARREDGG